MTLRRRELSSLSRCASWPVHAAALAGLVGLALVVTVDAHAYVRTPSCFLEGGGAFQCEEDQEPVPVFWPSRCANYHIEESGTRWVSFETAEAVVRDAFDTWNSVSCSYFEAPFTGLTNERRAGYRSCNGTSGNANVVMFRDDDWPHDPLIVALTSVTYEFRTGIVRDADIELNSQWFRYNVLNPGSDERGTMDIQNTLTHEIGHFLGLDHTTEENFVGDDLDEIVETTMFASAIGGETKKRTLHPDDIAGLCAIFPMEQADAAMPCEIGNDGYFEAPAKGPGTPCDDDGGRCSSSLSAQPPSGPTLLLMAGVLVAISTQRRRLRDH